MGSKKKNILIGVAIIFVISILLWGYFLFNKSFVYKNFKKEVDIEVFSDITDLDFDVCYGNKLSCKDANYTYNENDLNLDKLGTYEVKYKVTYNKKEEIITRTINVVDTTPPELEITEDVITMCTNNNKTPKVEKKAFDKYDGDLTDKITETVFDDYILYEVVDSSNNRNEVKVSISREDNVAPVLTLSGKNKLILYQYKTFVDPGYTAIDNCDGNITKSVVVESNIDSNKLGDYKVKYKVKDKNGNEALAERTVSVVEVPPIPEPTGQTIYLTFDDGPSAYTGKLLDILKKYDVKATFFVTGLGINSGYGNMIKRAYDEGHAIGLHSNTHDYKKIYKSEEAYFEDLEKIGKRVKDLIGEDVKIIRFPGGSSNTVSRFNKGIMTRLSSLVEENGYAYFDWNISSGDAGETTQTSKVISNVIKYLGSGKNYIVLQHDTKGFSVNAVESIIEYGLSHGFTFEKLDVNSPRIHHGINN